MNDDQIMSETIVLEDVAGVDEAKAELQKVASFLKGPRRYSQLGARIPKGVLERDIRSRCRTNNSA